MLSWTAGGGGSSDSSDGYGYLQVNGHCRGCTYPLGQAGAQAYVCAPCGVAGSGCSLCDCYGFCQTCAFGYTQWRGMCVEGPVLSTFAQKPLHAPAPAAAPLRVISPALELNTPATLRLVSAAAPSTLARGSHGADSLPATLARASSGAGNAMPSVSKPQAHAVVSSAPVLAIAGRNGMQGKAGGAMAAGQEAMAVEDRVSMARYGMCFAVGIGFPVVSWDNCPRVTDRSAPARPSM